MTTTVRYTGSAKQFFEIALTGRPRQWTPGQQQDVSDSDAATLIATNNFVPASPSRARSAGQLAGTPSAADIVLSGEFFLYTDPTQRYVINAAGTAYVSAGVGGGAVASVAGKTGTVTLASTDLTDGAALNVAITNALKAPTSWAASASGGTPTLTSGTAVLGTSFNNTTAGITTLSPAIDGISQVAQGDKLICFTTGTYTLLPAGGGYLGSFSTTAALQTAYPAASNPACMALVNSVIYTSNGTTWLTKAAVPTAISTGTPLTDANDCANLVCSSTPALTVNSGLKNGFGCSIKGTFTTAGTATITDLRATTGTAFCCLVQTDTSGAGATYDLVGTK